MIKVKNIYTKEIAYFRFFDSKRKHCFWYTPTTEACGFGFSEIRNYEPIGMSWKEVKNGQN